MIRAALAGAMAVLIAAPALAQATDAQTAGASAAVDAGSAPAPGSAPAGKAPEVSGVTVSPKTAPISPKLQCPDLQCVKDVVREIKVRYPKVYRGLMQWCLANESGRMAFSTSDAKTMAFSIFGGQMDDPSATKYDSGQVEKTVCDSRFEK